MKRIFKFFSVFICMLLLVQLEAPMLGLVAKASGTRLISFAYPNFSNSTMNSLLNLTGSPNVATISGGVLILTQNQTGQAGGAFYTKKVSIGADKSFSTHFSFRFPHSGSPADGIVFVLNNSTNAIGQTGGGIGYGGISPSLGIEFDTYYNSDYGDISANHIGVNTNGSVRSVHQVNLNGTGITLSDQAAKYAWIDYNGATNLLEVRVSNSTTRPAAATLSYTINLSNLLTSEDVYAGFTAATGGSCEQHGITSWYFDSQYLPISITDGTTYVTAPTNVTVSSSPSSVGGSSTITVNVKNADGTNAANAAVTLSTDRGTLSATSLTTDSGGNATATFYNMGTTAGYANIKAVTQSGGALGTASVYCAAKTASVLTTPSGTGLINLSWSVNQSGSYTYTLRKQSTGAYASLLQGTADTSYADTAVADSAAPGAVTYANATLVGPSSGRTASIAFGGAADYGSTYNYYVDATENGVTTVTSPVSSATLTSGIQGYSVVVDQSPGTVPGTTVNCAGTTFVTETLSDGTWYAHIRTIDNAGNASSTYTKSFYVDNTSPVLALNGDSTIHVNLGEPFTDPGVTATDDHDGNLAASVVKTGSVNNRASGTYTLTYNVQDSAGNAANTVTRTVVVAPIYSDINVSPSTSGGSYDSRWTKDSVTVSLSGGINANGFLKYQYSTDNASWSDVSGSSLIISANQDATYTFRVVGIDGSIHYASGGLPVRIDKTSPTSSVGSILCGGSPYVWSPTVPAEGDVTITLQNPNSVLSPVTYYYSLNGTDWTAFSDDTLTISDTGNSSVTYSFKAVSDSGCEGDEITASVYIIKPVYGDITVQATLPDSSAYGGEWTNQNVTYLLSGGINSEAFFKYQYSTDGILWYDMEGAGYNTLTVSAQQSAIYRFRALSKGGSTGAQTSGNTLRIDKTSPSDVEITFSTNSFRSFLHTVTFGLFFKNTVDVTLTAQAGDTASTVTLQYMTVDAALGQTYSPGGVWVNGSAFSVAPEFKGNIYARAVDGAGNVSDVVCTDGFVVSSQTPTIGGAESGKTYWVGRVITYGTGLAGVRSATCQKDGAAATSLTGGQLLSAPGRYVITVTDNAGNQKTLSFVINALPAVTDIVYTPASSGLIAQLRTELNSHTDLPEPYRTNTDNAIKALEDRYALLSTQVDTYKNNVQKLQDSISRLPFGTDGLIALKDTIQQQYGAIGPDSSLTPEQKAALAQLAALLKSQLDAIAALQRTVDSLKALTAAVPNGDDGLMGQKTGIQELISSIRGLTREQRSLLSGESSILETLLARIGVLQSGVDSVQGMIDALPSAGAVLKTDAQAVAAANTAFQKLNAEQKSLLKPGTAAKLSEITQALLKLMLYNAPNDVTVTGMDGVAFAPDVYLVVTLVTQDADSASSSLGQTVQPGSVGAGKEIVKLYTISLYKGEMEIEPDGRVQVKIKIPDDLKGRTSLEIIRIGDDGTVTRFETSNDGDYLSFVTDHFSYYAIVADKLPFPWWIILLIVLALSSVFFLIWRRRRKKKQMQPA